VDRTFYLGTHHPGWLAKASVPLFVSRTRLIKRRTFPGASAHWALDSGAFTELSIHGRWTVPAEQYAREARLFSQEIGSLDFAAPQDWMCICRRQATKTAGGILASLATAYGLRLHAFGFKTLGLRQSSAYLRSADSMAWSMAARRATAPLPGCSHATCANCFRFALLWRSELPEEWR